MNSMKTLFLATRPHFLILSMILVFLGGALARMEGNWHTGRFLLCLAGLTLLHISTNVLNDYFDHRSGIDAKTIRTPFNGGTGFIQNGRLSPRATLFLGVASFLLALPIGGYFVIVLGVWLLPLFILGAVLVLLGTSHLTRFGFGIGELSAGLGLGLLPVVGTATIITGHFTNDYALAAIPSGILATNLLLLNEFPDLEADKNGGRKTLPILLGLNKSASLFAFTSLLVPAWILFGVLVGFYPHAAIGAVATFPLLIKSLREARSFDDPKQMMSAQAANIANILLTQLLLGTLIFLG